MSRRVRITRKDGSVYFVDQKTREEIYVKGYTTERRVGEDGIVYFVDPKTEEEIFVQGYSQKKPDSEFKTLVGVGNFISGAGWVVIALSIFGIIIGVAQSNSVIIITTIVGSIISIILGLLLVASGQSISCFVTISRNTKKTNELLEKLIIQKEINCWELKISENVYVHFFKIRFCKYIINNTFLDFNMILKYMVENITSKSTRPRVQAG